jgi:glutaredoxin-like protein NrdH
LSAKVILYSKANCPKCTLTEKALQKHSVMYSVRKVDENQDAYDFVTKTLGYSQAPVVYVDADGVVDHWSDFRPDRVKALAARKAQT